MSNFDEMRGQAWNRLWKGLWFWKLLGSSLLLGVCASAANAVLRGIMGRLGMVEFMGYLKALYGMNPNGMESVANISVPAMLSASCLEAFLMVIMGGIAAYGTAVVALKCARNDESRWMAEAFGGFADPLGLGLAKFLQSLVTTVGFVLLIFPGFVALYRYRILFLVKADHPEWSAMRCFGECGRMMDGRKWQLFLFDCSYWKIITVTMLPLLFASMLLPLAIDGESRDVKAMAALGMALLVLSVVPLAAVCGQYMSAGLAFFYEGIKQDQQKGNENELVR